MGGWYKVDDDDDDDDDDIRNQLKLQGVQIGEKTNFLKQIISLHRTCCT